MKTIKEAALFIKSHICNVPDSFEIDDSIKNGFDNTEIIDGVKQLQSILQLIADNIIHEAENGSEMATTEKPANDFHLTLPELTSPFFMLFCIGLCGEFPNGSSEYMTIDGTKLFDTFKKSRGKNHNRYLLFLSNLGFEFSVDITAKSFKLNKTDVLEVRYPDSPSVLIGLKILTEATVQVSAQIHKAQKAYAIQPIFMRCDYHALTLPKKFGFDIRDCAASLSDERESFCIKIHEMLLENGCKYETAYKMQDYVFTYTSKAAKRVVASIRIGFGGECIKINSKRIDEDASFLADAPANILQVIKDGHNCVKGEDPNACNPRCEYIRFNLDGVEYTKCRHLNFILPIDTAEDREYVKTWLSHEI